MGRFKFKLQTLRRLRQLHRDEQRGRLAQAYEAERILMQQQADVAAEQQSIVEAQRVLVQAPAVDVNQLLTATRYRMALDAQARALAEQAERVGEEVERRRQAALQAEREVRVLDKLEERQRRLHAAAAAAAEAKRLDEVAVNRWEAPRL